jgi:hypothetical protein
MSDERKDFIEKYEKSFRSALKLEPIMLKYFDKTYGEYLYKVSTSRKNVFWASEDYRAEKINFVFVFELEYNDKVYELRTKIWEDFNNMFNFNPAIYGCPIDIDFLKLKIERV